MTGFPATLSSDVYKVFHPAAGHPDIVGTYENFTNRSGRLSNVKGNTHVVNLGWQYVIKKHLIGRWDETFFNVSKESAIARYKAVTKSILGYEVSATHLERLHDLGYLPLRVKTYAEGTLVPYGVACATFETTTLGFEWLPGMLETVISQEVWPIQTAATTSLAYQRKQKELFEATGGPMELLPFMIHDFSARGGFGEEASAMSGFGHLAAGSLGSDTIAAGMFAEKYYNAEWDKELIMASVNATEHSVTCGWLEEGEYEYFKHLMETVAPEGILSVVSDTWDFWNTVTAIAAQLKEVIMNRNGKLVFRPDSGDPVDILCGTQYRSNSYLRSAEQEGFEAWKASVAEDIDELFRADLDPVEPWYSWDETYQFEGQRYGVTYTPVLNRHDKTYYFVDNDGDDLSKCTFTKLETKPEDKGLVEILWDTFGGTVTDEGYKMLDEHVGAIYGDAITLERQAQIGERLMAKGFVPQVVLGVGSYSFQYVTRDTHGSAMKATNVTKQVAQNNKLQSLDEGGSLWLQQQALVEDQAIFKDPKTDPKKRSAKGLLRVEREDGELVQYDMQSREQETQGELKTVFADGILYNEQTLQGIREVVSSQF
jgi:nicotinamide phosphoribosyltransferase